MYSRYTDAVCVVHVHGVNADIAERWDTYTIISVIEAICTDMDMGHRDKGENNHIMTMPGIYVGSRHIVELGGVRVGGGLRMDEDLAGWPVEAPQQADNAAESMLYC